MSLLFACKNDGAGMNVIKNVPVIENENVGISQTLQERKKMGYPKIGAMGFGTQCNKKCDWFLAPKQKSAFRKTCLPLKG